MSLMRLGRKLQPAKKAWKSFTKTVHAKIHKLNIPKAITTTIQRVISGFHSLRFFLPTKRRSISRPSTSTFYHQVHRKNFASIHIDELFAGEPELPVHDKKLNEHGETSRGKEVLIEKRLPGKSNSMYSIEDAWKAVVASSPNLRGVEERADEFIVKFREDMKIQKERSILEFQEMLTRSA
ncbi:Cotton fiber protein [Quillaja saponaria]|uniref:Cotton fiber protein n=1 Tax=Quillaja saponaria TaxID=32244 RepID=A0AAD7LAU5_QUISA|nr:Cotton fiber protein [Quillaja saponaria]KAJ7954708.1 Cotton fiber protein [Quillaja saponaria]